MRIPSSLSAVFLALSVISCGSGGSQVRATKAVTVQTDSASYEFQAEVADTPALRAQGLMSRSDLTEESAMLFLWDEDTQGSFWMKDTPTSLDIIFINSSKSVNSVFTHTVPNSTDLITPSEPYRYVLEVKAGFVDRSGLSLGDSVHFQ